MLSIGEEPPKPFLLPARAGRVSFRALALITVVTVVSSAYVLKAVSTPLTQVKPKPKIKTTPQPQRKMKKEESSLFIPFFLPRGQVKLNLILIATRYLEGPYNQVKRGMVGQIVGIVDNTQNSVLLEIFFE